MEDARKKAAHLFLEELKPVISRWGVFFVRRRDVTKTLVSLNITEKIGVEEILSLSVKNYVSGPEADRDKPGSIWVFGKVVNGMTAYIKLKLFVTDGGRKFAKCISFHEAENSLHFPFA